MFAPIQKWAFVSGRANYLILEDDARSASGLSMEGIRGGGEKPAQPSFRENLFEMATQITLTGLGLGGDESVESDWLQ